MALLTIQVLLQLVLACHSMAADQVVEEQSREELPRLSNTDLASVRVARRANFVPRTDTSQEVQRQGSTNRPWVFFKHDDSTRPRNSRGATQTNATQPHSHDKNSQQINNSEAEEVVTIQIAGEPVIIPDFEITPKPQRQKDAEIIQIPVEIQATETIIAEPKADNEIEETAQPKSSDLTLFKPSSDLFHSADRSSHETWRSSGPNHVFEIFVPFDGKPTENSNRNRLNILNNTPKFVVNDLATKTTTELKSLSNEREKQRNANKKRVNKPPKQETKENVPKTKFELQTMFKFVADQQENLDGSKKLTKVRKPKVNTKARKPKVLPKPSINSKDKAVSPCPSSLEECVDSCISHEDIYAYSGCVVQCGESCG